MRTTFAAILAGLASVWTVITIIAAMAVDIYLSVQAWPNLLVIFFVIPMVTTLAAWLVMLALGMPLTWVAFKLEPDREANA